MIRWFKNLFCNKDRYIISGSKGNSDEGFFLVIKYDRTKWVFLTPGNSIHEALSYLSCPPLFMYNVDPNGLVFCNNAFSGYDKN